MVRGYFTASDVNALQFLDESTTAIMYVNILRRNLHTNVKKLGIRNSFKLYDDNVLNTFSCFNL